MRTPKILLRSIAAVYLLLFIGALLSSGYLLAYTIALKPILLIRLLQYLLLCVLFSILVLNCLKALTLKPEHLRKLATSTQNFKWLFSIATVICLAAWTGIFNNVNDTKRIEITIWQILVLIVLAIFCFWSDSKFKGLESPEDENIEA